MFEAAATRLGSLCDAASVRGRQDGWKDPLSYGDSLVADCRSPGSLKEGTAGAGLPGIVWAIGGPEETAGEWG